MVPSKKSLLGVRPLDHASIWGLAGVMLVAALAASFGVLRHVTSPAAQSVVFGGMMAWALACWRVEERRVQGRPLGGMFDLALVPATAVAVGTGVAVIRGGAAWSTLAPSALWPGWIAMIVVFAIPLVIARRVVQYLHRRNVRWLGSVGIASLAGFVGLAPGVWAGSIALILFGAEA